MTRISISAFGTKINTLLADNNSGDVTEARLRELYDDIKDSFAHLDVTDAKYNASNPNGYTTPSDVVPLLAPFARTTGPIAFDRPAIYGSIAAPLTSNITLDATGAVLGQRVLIVHNKASVPTFGTEFIATSDSVAYATSQNNFIECTFFTPTLVKYKIYQ